MARSNGPAVAKAGQTWAYTLRVSNRGNVEFRGWVDVRLTTKGPRTGNSYASSYMYLPPMISKEMTASYTVPARATKGRYTVQAVVDPYDFVDERIETNNTASLCAYTVK
jgi:subtilase family serine protease